MSWRSLGNDLKNRFLALVRPNQFESDLDEELRSHLEMEIEHRMERGATRHEAERSARIALGGVEGIKENCRDSWGARFVQDLLRDLRGALRRLVRYRRYSLVVIASLALGLGAALVVFAMVDAVLLRPLPFHEPDRLVKFWETTPEGNFFSVSDANLADFREQIDGLSDLAAIRWPGPRPAMLRDGERLALDAMAVTPNFFRTLGVSAALGRTFGDEEERQDAPARSVLLSHEIWRSHFASDPAIHGREVDLDGHVWTIVGVLPEEFRWNDAQVFLPYRLDQRMPRGDHRLEAFGRLAPGVSLEQAREQADVVAARLSEQYPDSNGGWGALVLPLPESLLGPEVRNTQWVLLSAVGLLLLLACVNVANLFLAQLSDRQEELKLRRVLGSGRLRILQQVLTESVVLGVCGALAGLALAFFAVPWFRGLDVPVPRMDEMAVDLRVAAAAAVLAVVTSLLFGLLPAWSATRSTRGVHAQRMGQRRAGAGRTRAILVACEVALATVLAVGAGLLMQSFESLAAVDSGLGADGREVLLAEIDLPVEHYREDGDHVRRFYSQLVERTADLPGVRHVGASMASPYSGTSASNYVATQNETRQDAFVTVRWRAVTPGLFRTLGIPLLRGSDFSDVSGTPDAEPKLEAIVSASLADRLWPGEDPIGQPLRWRAPDGTLFEVVGVTQDVQDVELGQPMEPTVYLSQQVVGWPSMTLAVRSDAPSALAAPIRELISELDHKLAAPAFSTLEDQRREALAQPQLSLQVMSVFSLVALLLAAAGVYGVVAYAVSRQQRDLGVRLALGASPNRLVRGLTLRNLAPVVAGLGVGLLAALVLGSTMGSMLYETSPAEPKVLLGVAAALGLVGLASAWLPARRAAGLDPLVALREE